MRYIDRDESGDIVSAYMREQYEGQERVPEIDLQEFLNPIPDAAEEKIKAEIIELNRVAAIQSLKDKGELSIDYQERQILEA